MPAASHNPQRITLEIEGLAHGGEGVARREGLVVFVAGALPGEVVEARVVQQKKAWARAEVVRVVHAAAERVTPACEVAAACGGCGLWHVTPEAELPLKARAALDAVARIGGLSEEARAEVEARMSFVEAPSRDGWRRRATWHLVYDRRAGRHVMGFFARGSHEVIDTPGCRILHPALTAARAVVIEAAEGLARADVFVETARDAEDSPQVVLTWEGLRLAPGQTLAMWQERLEGVVRRHGALVRGCVVRHDGQRHELGDPTIDADAALAIEGDARHLPRHDAGRFRQAHGPMNHALAAQVRAWTPQGARVLELFCGSGNLSAALAGHVTTLHGVEGDPQAVALAEGLARAASWPHMTFARADLFEIEALRALPIGRFDTLLLDPPRAGAREACEALADATSLQHILYVSCEAACLGRDLARLGASGWRIDRLAALDLFPASPHVELLARLTR